jgi:hypothetical protein
MPAAAGVSKFPIKDIASKSCGAMSQEFPSSSSVKEYADLEEFADWVN